MMFVSDRWEDAEESMDDNDNDEDCPSLQLLMLVLHWWNQTISDGDCV